MKKIPVHVRVIQAIEELLEDHHRMFPLAHPRTMIQWSRVLEVRNARKAVRDLRALRLDDLAQLRLRLGCLLEVMDNSVAAVTKRGFRTTDQDLQREITAAKAILAET